MQTRRVRQRTSEATVRVGALVAISAVLRDFGIDPDEVLTEAAIDPDLLGDPDNLITYRARGRLVALCVARTGCGHFGLLVGERMNLQSFGIVGLLARNAADVGTALRSFIHYLHLHSQGAVMTLTVDPGLAVLAYGGIDPSLEGSDQTGDGSVASALNVMRTLCGPAFAPIEARFAHRKPEDIRPFRQFFRAPLRYDAEQYALVFASDWLGARVPGNDAETERLLQKQIDVLEAKHGEEFPEIVHSVLRSALLTGQASEAKVAALFSMHPRTLGRRLEEFGTGFQRLLDEARFDIARQMLADTSLEIAQIGEMLGYARASVFSRAFRRWSGTTPTVWRAKRALG